MPEVATATAPLTVFYGGTFDPVHNGHLGVARHARDRLDATIRLMPAADPPHRDTPGAGAIHRARMLDLAVAGEPRLKVDRRELSRTTRSWTIDTLQGIRRELGDAAPVALLVGADSLLGLPQWKDWQALFELSHFVVAERPGIDLSPSVLPGPLAGWLDGRWTDSVAALNRAPGGRVLRLRQPLHEGSATAIRARVAAGRPLAGLVPDAVAAYIARHWLYAGGAASSASL
ncbi:nicotinate-nucleotide adenylyltransferase [Novilysobacter arseniciresistens]|uniref:nicotinate-nucleotide adenylyltransferase n=1 Tax=Novilysobacter arseniciresistens TaxID=1385522 RepID=UPI000A6A652A|nr:nicotinate-nucleotide adenylyltransferase [Lysobacter arseniciresistens]